MSELSELLPSIDNQKNRKAKLYFVTRQLKDGFKKTSRASDRFLYKCWAINTDAEIQSELFDVFLNKLKTVSDEGMYTVAEYVVVTDDSEKKVLKYSKKSNISSFIHIVDDDLRNSATLPVVQSLEEISGNLWAYVIEVVTDDKIICGIKKMAPSKVLHGKKGIFTQFNIKEKSLVLFRDQTVTFDKTLDAIYFDDVFYAISKDNFEEIVGLQEEYKIVAKEVAQKIVENPLIEMTYDLKSAIDEKMRFVRKLTNIRDEIDKLDAARIRKMKGIAKSYNLTLNIGKDGKINISNESELDVMIKLLDDYYLESKQTGKKYGAPVKSEL